MGILDASFAPAPTGYGILAGASPFPDVTVPKPQTPQELWAAIDAENAKANADADRRNAAAQAAANNVAGSPYQPYPAPDQNAPAIQMATGNTPLAVDPASLRVPFGALSPAAPAVPPPPAAGPVPLPVPRPISAPSSVDDTTLPSNATPTAGSGLPVKADHPDDVPQTSMMGRMGSALSRIGNNIDNHQATLLAMAGGFAGAPSVGVGMGRAFTAAAAALPQDQKMMMQQAGIGPTYAALVKSGVPPQTALAAVYNPTILKSVTDNYLGDRKGEVHMVKDEFGAEHPYVFDPYSKSFQPAPGTGAAGSAPSAGIQQITDRIATRRAAGATQAELLSEIPQQYQGYVKSLVAGEAIPNNIGRSQLRGPLMTMAHAVDDHFDESLIPQRMKYAQGIGNTTSATAPGGQRQAISTATGHFADLAEALVAQNNVNGGVLAGLPGSGPAATAYNAVANSSSKMSGNSAKIAQESHSTAGEMGKLYSGSAGGGVREREETAGRYGSNLPPLQAAGALEATRDLLIEKIRANEAERDQAFGPNSKERIDFMDSGVQKNLDRVNAAIAKLRGQDTSSPASAPAPVPAAPLAPGASTVINGVTIRRIN